MVPMKQIKLLYAYYNHTFKTDNVFLINVVLCAGDHQYMDMNLDSQ